MLERRVWRVLLLVAAAVALCAVLLEISKFHPLSSDGANNALQGWDMLHGRVLLHGWIIGDATYYTLELPLFALVESVTGLTPHVVGIEVTITFLVVLAIAMIAAKGRSGGASAVLRCLAVLAVLTAPLASPPGPMIMLSVPIHFGTGVFMLLAFLIYDRVHGRYAAPVLLLAVLTLGQLGDATVLYCGVLPVLGVGCYRLVLIRDDRIRDMTLVAAAVLSVPAELALRSLIRHHGGYTMIKPHAGIVPVSLWLHNARITAYDVLQLFGYTSPSAGVSVLWFLRILAGMLALAAVALGALAVLRRWHRADPCEQLILLAVGLNLAGFALTPNATTDTSYDLCFVLTGGAVLAARLVTPRLGERISAQGRVAQIRWAAPFAALTAWSLILGLTLVPAATVVPQLAGFLQARGLTYGLGAYADASSVALQSGDRVQVRAVVTTPTGFAAYRWETKSGWFDASAHTADFFIASASPGGPVITAAEVESVYGPPQHSYAVGGRDILVYPGNLLDKIGPPTPGEG